MLEAAPPFFGNGIINKNDGNLILTASGGFITPATDLAVSLGSNSLRYNGVFGNVTSTNATTTNFFANVATVSSTVARPLNNDLFTIASNGITVNSADGLQVSFIQGDDADATDDNAGIRIKMTSNSGDADPFRALVIETAVGAAGA